MAEGSHAPSDAANATINHELAPLNAPSGSRGRRYAALSVAQIGPGPVLIAAVIFVYSRSGVLWGTGLHVLAVFCVAFDNVVRSMLIKRGADLPLLLIFARVIGGLIAFGVIGLFIGPVVLIVWLSENEGAPENRPAGP